MVAEAQPSQRREPDGVLDLVCGMTIAPADAVGTLDHRGHIYYFCSESCLEQFRADPAKFVDPQRKTESTTVTDMEAKYTCPMHPEIRQKAPGACPICGMALEPVTITLEDQPNQELEDMTRRFRWSLCAHRTNSRVHDRRVHSWAATASASACGRVELDRARARDACGFVGGMAVLSSAAGRRSSADT